MDFGGFLPLSWPRLDPRWIAVEALAVPVEPGLRTPEAVHCWARHHIAYAPDRVDHWQTPLETLQRGAGDCEDIAILERALLIAAGYPSDDLWLVIAYDAVARQDHAVLVAGEKVLDCRNDELQDAAALRDYMPKRAFRNREGFTFGRRI